MQSGRIDADSFHLLLVFVVDNKTASLIDFQITLFELDCFLIKGYRIFALLLHGKARVKDKALVEEIFFGKLDCLPNLQCFISF